MSIIRLRPTLEAPSTPNFTIELQLVTGLRGKEKMAN